MSTRIFNGFAYFVAVVLMVSGVSHLWAAASTARVFDIPDPLLFLTVRRVFYLVAGGELALSAFLLAAPDRFGTLKLSLIGWWFADLLVYHFGSLSLGAADLFVCLGNLTGSLPIPPRILSPFTTAVNVSFFAGACGLLIYGWLARRKSNGARRMENDGELAAARPGHA